MFLKKYYIFFLIRFFFIFIFFLFCNFFKVYGADYKVDYEIIYDLRDFEKNQAVRTNFNIKITNLRSDVYVKKFSIRIPSSFYIYNLKSFDDYGEIENKITSEDDFIKLEMDFSNPRVGRGSVNNFYLNFDQKNLFKVNGLIWEVFLPVIEKNDNDSYRIKVIIPETTDKKISIAKPKPDLVSKSEIIWINPKIKTIYAVFGDYQIYKGNLSYHLKNSEIFPVYKEIALPPDTIYQKIYVESLNEKPVEVYKDLDGNYLAKYLLKPFEEKKIIFSGFFQIFSKPREDFLNYSRKKIADQEKYLLRESKYWSIESFDNLGNLNNVSDIYYFVVNNLRYNYEKIEKNNYRLGAVNVLKNPSYAVCLEFTDLFIALSREKGIMSRQINGYGFSFDPKLQPLSLNLDVLHAWPEYFDESLQLWKPIDPTWENTSGIDYFNSLDLNHIVFSIHGKSPDYPLPAGTYKINDSKDIIINPVDKLPKEVKKIKIDSFSFFENKKENNYQINLKIENQSNISLINIPLDLKSSQLNFLKNKLIIDYLLPMEKKEFVFYLDKLKETNLKDDLKNIEIYLDGIKISEEKVKIPGLLNKIAFLVFLILGFILLSIIFFIKKYLIKKND